jgi:hypothetical protein
LIFSPVFTPFIYASLFFNKIARKIKKFLFFHRTPWMVITHPRGNIALTGRHKRAFYPFSFPEHSHGMDHANFLIKPLKNW